MAELFTGANDLYHRFIDSADITPDRSIAYRLENFGILEECKNCRNICKQPGVPSIMKTNFFCHQRDLVL